MPTQDPATPIDTPHDSALERAVSRVARRSFVIFGLGALAACTSTGRKLASSGSGASGQSSGWLPGPVWPDEIGSGRPTYADSADTSPAATCTDTACPAPSAQGGAGSAAVALFGARPRSDWASEAPSRALINPMLPVAHITVHHDGIPTVFWGDDLAGCRTRIEFIRRGHRNKGWGDIGYHLVIDRAGRVWEGRPLQWQGAHVRNHNEGNIGILVMGNFEVQKPTQAQLASLDRVVRAAKLQWKVSKKNLRSHREWEDASTSCPGKNLQSQWSGIRSRIA